MGLGSGWDAKRSEGVAGTPMLPLTLMGGPLLSRGGGGGSGKSGMAGAGLEVLLAGAGRSARHRDARDVKTQRHES